MRNPLKPPRAFNPLPDIVVVVTGGVPTEDDAKPSGKPVKYELLGESFAEPLMPVLVGSNVEIRNRGRRSPDLYSPDVPELIEAGPVSPKEKRLLKKFGPAHKAVEIRARDSAHLSGRIVAFESPYFARVTDSGKFSIKGVPAGRWQIRVWYRTGWLQLPPTTVEVVSRKPVSKTIALPARLEVASAADGAAKKAPTKSESEGN